MEPKSIDPVAAPAATVVEPAAPIVAPAPAVDPAPVAPVASNNTAPVAPTVSVTPAPEQKKGGGHSTLIAIILLLLVYPIGLIYMFMATAWPKWLKILLTLPVLLGVIGMIVYAVMSILG